MGIKVKADKMKASFKTFDGNRMDMQAEGKIGMCFVEVFRFLDADQREATLKRLQAVHAEQTEKGR